MHHVAPHAKACYLCTPDCVCGRGGVRGGQHGQFFFLVGLSICSSKMLVFPHVQVHWCANAFLLSFPDLPEASQKILEASQTFRKLLESFWKVPRRFWKFLGSFWKLPRSFWKLPRSFWKLPTIAITIATRQQHISNTIGTHGISCVPIVLLMCC